MLLSDRLGLAREYEVGEFHPLATTALTTALYHAFSPGYLGSVVYLKLGDTEDRFGGGVVAVVVLLGSWLLVANALLLAGYETDHELDSGVPQGGRTARRPPRVVAGRAPRDVPSGRSRCRDA